jgi:hypothetical protein
VKRADARDVSSIVQVDAISPDSVSRVTNMLITLAKAPRDEDHRLRIDTSYDDERARLKVFISGSAETTVGFIRTVATLVAPKDASSTSRRGKETHS